VSGAFWLSERQWRRLAPLLLNLPRGMPRVKGELYPCKPDIFAATYEPAA
jgi:hypothetical protein